MLRSRLYIAQLFYLLFSVQYVRLENQSGSLKYIAAIGITLLLLLFSRKEIKLRNTFILMPCLVYIILGLVGNVVSGYFDFYTLKMGMFLLVPSAFALIVYEKGVLEGIDICRTVFLGYALYSITTFTFSPFSVVVESTRAFVYGLFAIYFLTKKDWGFCVAAVLLCFISHKRIGFIGMLAVLCMIPVADLLLKYFKRIKSKAVWITFGVLCTIAAYYIAYMVHTQCILLFFDAVHLDPSGRQTIWGEYQQFADWNVCFTGHGLGFVISKIEDMKVLMYAGTCFENLHCDFYRGYIELGFLGFGIWIISYFQSYYSLTKTSEEKNKALIFALSAIAFTFILFITDNVLSYIEYCVPLNLMLLDMTNSSPAQNKRQALRLKAHYLSD